MPTSSNKIIWAILILTAIIASIGWYLGAYVVSTGFFAPIKQVEVAAPKPLDGSKDPAALYVNENLIKLPAIVTDIKSDLKAYKKDEVWVRVEISLLLNKGRQLTNASQAKISENFLNYFKQTDLMDLRGPLSLVNLKEDLLNRANFLTSGAIKSVFITTLVTQ